MEVIEEGSRRSEEESDGKEWRGRERRRKGNRNKIEKERGIRGRGKEEGGRERRDRLRQADGGKDEDKISQNFPLQIPSLLVKTLDALETYPPCPRDSSCPEERRFISRPAVSS